MGMIMKKILYVCLLIAAFFSAFVSAATVSYQFTGIVTDVAPALVGGFNVDEILVGRFDVDTTGTQQVTRTIYQATNLTINIGSNYTITGTSGSMIVTNDMDLGGTMLDGVTVYFSNSSTTTVFGDPVNGSSPGYFDIQLDWFGNGPLSTQSLPLAVLVDSGELDRSNINFPGDSERLSYQLTSMSAVPVPASIWLFSTGLLGLFGVTRRRINSQ